MISKSTSILFLFAATVIFLIAPGARAQEAGGRAAAGNGLRRNVAALCRGAAAGVHHGAGIGRTAFRPPPALW